LLLRLLLEGLLSLESLLRHKGLLRLLEILLESLLGDKGLLGLLLGNKSGCRGERGLCRLSESRCGGLLWNSGLGEKLSVRGVGRVDEGVDPGAVSTGRNSIRVGNGLGGLSSRTSKLLWLLLTNKLGLSSLLLGLLRGELGCVGVHLEVEVGRVGGVDKRVVKSLLNWSSKLLLYLYWLLSNRLGLLLLSGNWGWSGLLSSQRCLWSTGSLSSNLLWLCVGKVWIERSRVEAVGSLGDMISFEDPEPILASCVSDSDGFAVIVNVAILPDSLPISCGLLPEYGTILLSKGRAKPSVTSVEPLLLQYFGIFGVKKLTASGRGKTRGDNKFEHFRFSYYSLFCTSS